MIFKAFANKYRYVAYRSDNYCAHNTLTHCSAVFFSCITKVLQYENRTWFERIVMIHCIITFALPLRGKKLMITRKHNFNTNTSISHSGHFFVREKFSLPSLFILVLISLSRRLIYNLTRFIKPSEKLYLPSIRIHKVSMSVEAAWPETRTWHFWVLIWITILRNTALQSLN